MRMRKWLIVIALILVFALSVLCGFMVKSYINFSKKESENNAILAENGQENKAVNTASAEVTVSPNSEVIITQKFSKCGHTITKREEAPREIVNLNKEKVQEYFEGWSIDKFTSNEIEISFIERRCFVIITC